MRDLVGSWAWLAVLAFSLLGWVVAPSCSRALSGHQVAGLQRLPSYGALR